MSVRVLQGDCRDVRTGRFVKGHSASPATQFKPGQHWRPRKPTWDREWLVREYVERGLCRDCHGWVHSRENVSREYLA